MQTSACFEGMDGSEPRRGEVAALAGNSLRLRANVREALQQLVVAASEAQRRLPGMAGGMVAALHMARVRTEAYCDHLGRDLEPSIARRSGFGAVLTSHLRRYRARQLRELAGIEQLLDESPRADGVAHAVHVAALVLLADLDAHLRDLDLIAVPLHAA